MFEKLLYPTDLSSASSKITPYVIEMAKKFNSEVHILYVAHVRHYYSYIELETGYVDDFENEIVHRAEKQIDDLIKKFNGIKVKATVLRGHPSQEVVSYAESEDIDLIIMGHSSTGIERAILGSVAGHTVKYSPVPVMVISPEILKP
jgi:nucleotide-binding universal stress UspA family protein